MVVLSSISKKRIILCGFAFCMMSAGCPEKSPPSVSKEAPVLTESDVDAPGIPRESEADESRLPRKTLDLAMDVNATANDDVTKSLDAGLTSEDMDVVSSVAQDAIDPSGLDTSSVADAVEEVKAPPVAAPATPEKVAETLKAIGRRVIVDEASLKATASNLGSAEEVIGRLDRMFEQLQVLKRIPLKPERKKLARSLKKYSREMGFDVNNLKVEERESSVSGIPSTLVGNTKIHYLSAQIRGVIQMEFELSPIDIDQLERWVKRLPAGVARMIEVESVRTREKRFLLKCKAFWFLPEVYPTHLPEILSLLGYLRSEGLTEPLAELREMASPERWKSIRTNVAGLKELEDSASKTLTMYARANHMEARWKFFEKMAKRIESRGLTELFD